MSRMGLQDWLGVTLDGSAEPITRPLMATSRALDRGNRVASMVGGAEKFSAPMATMVNGALSHVQEAQFTDERVAVPSTQ